MWLEKWKLRKLLLDTLSLQVKNIKFEFYIQIESCFDNKIAKR